MNFLLIEEVLYICTEKASFVVFLQLLAPLPIGFAVFLVHLATIPITGTSINPARSLGAAIIYNRDHTWNDHVSSSLLPTWFFLSYELIPTCFSAIQIDDVCMFLCSGSSGSAQWSEPPLQPCITFWSFGLFPSPRIAVERFAWLFCVVLRGIWFCVVVWYYHDFVFRVIVTVCGTYSKDVQIM